MDLTFVIIIGKMKSDRIRNETTREESAVYGRLKKLKMQILT
jgi:hypothetical protein